MIQWRAGWVVKDIIMMVKMLRCLHDWRDSSHFAARERIAMVEDMVMVAVASIATSGISAMRQTITLATAALAFRCDVALLQCDMGICDDIGYGRWMME